MKSRASARNRRARKAKAVPIARKLAQSKTDCKRDHGASFAQDFQRYVTPPCPFELEEPLCTKNLLDYGDDLDEQRRAIEGLLHEYDNFAPEEKKLLDGIIKDFFPVIASSKPKENCNWCNARTHVKADCPNVYHGPTEPKEPIIEKAYVTRVVTEPARQEHDRARDQAIQSQGRLDQAIWRDWALSENDVRIEPTEYSAAECCQFI